jgi:predicted enzyme related to lactoylglutathione lyase
MASSTNGKICYLELPAVDAGRSAAFYERMFGWRMRRRGDGATAFDDATGQVSGAFVVGREAWAGTPGLLVYVMVDDIEAAVRSVVEAGGEIVQPVGVDAPELTARFRDPGGNVVGLYQEPVKARG